MHTVWTIGHSTHTLEQFTAMLQEAEITAIADVRSTPFSRHLPQFNQLELKDALREVGIAYSFLGDLLGGRPKHKHLYVDGVANYEAMAKTDDFRLGLRRVQNGIKQFRIALMCSEHDPMDCHRCLLVSRELHQIGIEIAHIRPLGHSLSQTDIEEQLLAEANINPQQSDFLSSPKEQLSAAYRERARKVAFALSHPSKLELP